VINKQNEIIRKLKNSVDNIDCGWEGECVSLLSYPLNQIVEISEAIPDDVEEYFKYIISAGVSAIQTEDEGWVGSLSHFIPGKGYWIGTSQSVDFSYVHEGLSRVAAKDVRKIDMYPEKFEFTHHVQSNEQAFYFVKDLQLQSTEITSEDWLTAYCGDKVVGSRQYVGGYTDIPAMGAGSSDETIEYCHEGEVPHFKLLKANGDLIDLEGDIPAFSSNKVHILASLSEIISLPNEFSLDRAYPNPFNPTTTLSFAIPVDAAVSLSIYNMQGREVSTLIDGNMDAGYHSIVWDANSYSSGVYFVKMVAGEFVNTQKLMLVK